jgi:hypothetical protein
MSLVFLERDWATPSVPKFQILEVRRAEIFDLDGTSVLNILGAIVIQAEDRPSNDRRHLLKAVANAIRRFPSPETKELLKVLSKYRHGDVRKASAYAFTAFPETSTIQELKRMGQDPVIGVRTATARSTGFLIRNMERHQELDNETQRLIVEGSIDLWGEMLKRDPHRPYDSPVSHAIHDSVHNALCNNYEFTSKWGSQEVARILCRETEYSIEKSEHFDEVEPSDEGYFDEPDDLPI